MLKRMRKNTIPNNESESLKKRKSKCSLREKSTLKHESNELRSDPSSNKKFSSKNKQRKFKGKRFLKKCDLKMLQELKNKKSSEKEYLRTNFEKSKSDFS